MNGETSEILKLKELLVDELNKALGLPDRSSAKNIIRGIFGRAAKKFSELAVGLDRAVGEGGVSAGANWILPHFVKSHLAQGIDHIPAEGPLVIAANHPGSYDSIVISAHVARPDYKIIIGDIPFFERLPHISQHAIYAPNPSDIHGRMEVIRKSIRQLEAGGALLLFARGGIEPDPEIMPNADAEFGLWSRSLEIFLERVPRTRVLVTIVSGVIARSAFHHPITWFRKQRPDRQRLAFMLQMVRQTLANREIFGLVPRVSFGDVITPSENLPGDQTLEAITASARGLLQSHMAWQP